MESNYFNEITMFGLTTNLLFFSSKTYNRWNNLWSTLIFHIKKENEFFMKQLNMTENKQLLVKLKNLLSLFVFFTSNWRKRKSMTTKSQPYLWIHLKNIILVKEKNLSSIEALEPYINVKKIENMLLISIMVKKNVLSTFS